jgi:hypothetical protein
MPCHPNQPGNRAVCHVDFRAKIRLRQTPDRFAIAKDHELPRVLNNRIPPPSHLIKKHITPDIAFHIAHLAADHFAIPRRTRGEKLCKELVWEIGLVR